MKAIEVNGMAKSFGTRSVLSDVSFSVEVGDIYGFLGPNGAGKTTTINLLLGLLKPDSGSATVLGYDLLTEDNQIRANCGALLEDIGLYKWLSAEDNLRLYAKIWHMNKSDTEDRIKELLSSLNLYDRKKETPEKWSYGMKKKLAIARALLHKPRLLFLDEPTAGMDVSSAANLRDDLVDLAKLNNVTVFITTHNLSEVDQICNQIGVLHNGIITKSAGPEELKSLNTSQRFRIYSSEISTEVRKLLFTTNLISSINLDNNHVLVDVSEGKVISDVIALLVEKGVKISEIHRDYNSLENAFLSIIGERK